MNEARTRIMTAALNRLTVARRDKALADGTVSTYRRSLESALEDLEIASRKLADAEHEFDVLSNHA